jgi:hypothetical protein
LFGSGLFAAVVDAGASQSNNASSGDFSGPRNLQLALTAPSNTSCGGTLEWLDNVGPATVGSANLDDGTLTLSTNQRLCIRTRRAGTFTVRLGLRLVSDSEIGCSRVNLPEPQQDNDTCGSGIGELSKVLTFGGVSSIAAGSASNCSGTDTQRTFANANLDQTGTPIQVCVISGTDGIATFMPNVAINPAATNAELIAAQSDKVQFNYAVSLETS